MSPQPPADRSASIPQPSLNEWVVLGLLAERPAHGFALARDLQPDSDLGRILTVHRPLVYRALARLSEWGLCEPTPPEPGDAGPQRTTHRITPLGRRAVSKWLKKPVAHVRDLRIEFLVKLRLTERSRRDPKKLIFAQREILAATLESLGAEPDDRTEPDGVERWRRHNAIAATNFLNEVATSLKA